MKILLSSERPVEVIFLGKMFCVSKNDKKLIEVFDSKPLQIQYSFVGVDSLFFSAKLWQEGETYKCSNENIRVTNFGQNRFLIEILQKNACFLQKKCKKIEIDGLFYNFYQNGVVEIESEKELKFSAQYDIEISDAEVLELANGYKCIKLFGDDNISVILNGNFFEEQCHTNSIVEKTETGYKLLTDLKDIAQHGLVKVFDTTNGIKLVDEYSVYLNGKPKTVANENIVPLFFAQCIKAQDYFAAKNLLAGGLKTSVSIEHLKNFFSNFVEVSTINFENKKNNLSFIYQKNGIFFAKTYNFSLENGFIKNIREEK
jgi:hypothetical protein